MRRTSVTVRSHATTWRTPRVGAGMGPPTGARWRVGALAVGTALVLLASLPPRAEAQVRYGDAEGTIRMALGGDALITRRLRPFSEPDFLRVRELFTGSQVGFMNLEMLFHRYEEDVIPAAESGGTHMAAHPDMAGELVWFGVNMVSTANNHTMDYSAGGLRATVRALDAVGLQHAGAGENLALARAPAYLETAGGRVALISVASTFPSHMRAGAQRGDVRGRPGLSPLRFESVQVLEPGRLDTLRQLRDALGLGGSDTGDRVTLLGRTFVEGEIPGELTRAHPEDLAEIVASVRDARRQADWVIVTSHTHESRGPRQVPPDFLVELAHAVIDAGADVFTGHGPHILRGVEIYRGKPIFYSLSDIIRQNQTVPLLPADSYETFRLPPGSLPSDWYDARAEEPGRAWRRELDYFDTAVAVVQFQEGTLERVEIHPVLLGHQEHRARSGRPMYAAGEDAARVIETMRVLSEPFGTNIRFEGGFGVIRASDHR